MLEALLEQLSDAGLSSGHIRWTAPMAGVRVCDFDCAPPERFPARPTHPHLETLYCCRGGLLLSLAGGRQVRLKPREILLLSDPAQVRSVQFADLSLIHISSGIAARSVVSATAGCQRNCH